MKTGLLLMSLVVLFGGALLPQAAGPIQLFFLDRRLISLTDVATVGMIVVGITGGMRTIALSDITRRLRSFMCGLRQPLFTKPRSSENLCAMWSLRPWSLIPSSPPFYNEAGQQCREYQSSAWVSGRQNQIYGTACLQLTARGAWWIDGGGAFHSEPLCGRFCVSAGAL